ncbi:ribonuclease III family protein [Methanofollis formosanus]|uniref:Ribonuclease III family protein n=1 Tax=Methanofollis formosanus TaxID=299308 RepID=A0A8G1EEZ6_9EURY|nr:ribonuclease III domain-containing protein [Methanofollis formosanus]QYZ78433.1 ribonuclease III family protein [Methanofollis formosanus]
MEWTRKIELTEFLAQPGIGVTDLDDEAIARFDQAMTHRSYAYEHPLGPLLPRPDYERIEFLGDRVLNFIVAEYLFSHFDCSEGALSKRMEATKNEHLGTIVPATGIGLEQHILLGAGQPLTRSIIADVFEAFICALYLHLGLDRTREIVLGLIADDVLHFDPGGNVIGRLQEHLQQECCEMPEYHILGREGPDHAPTFACAVTVPGILSARGLGRSKADARRAAARKALAAMEDRAGA